MDCFRFYVNFSQNVFYRRQNDCYYCCVVIVMVMCFDQIENPPPTFETLKVNWISYGTIDVFMRFSPPPYEFLST